MAERIREKVNASHAFEILASFPGLSHAHAVVPRPFSLRPLSKGLGTRLLHENRCAHTVLLAHTPGLHAHGDTAFF